jgi:pyridoxal phosphate enzyme (YggS family)
VTAATLAHIEENMRRVRRLIEAACDRAGRDPGSVRLIAVSKGMAAAAVGAAVRAGVTAIGENYVQEAVSKKKEVGRGGNDVEWHLIGHLQSNKVRPALEAFDMIQTVDSVKIAAAIDSRSPGRFPILIEVNVAGEASKSGVAPEDLGRAVREIARLPNIDLRGLMTVAPAVADQEQARWVFRELAALAAANGLSELSMGMSGDFEAAIEQGATMVRIGRAIFGERRT